MYRRPLQRHLALISSSRRSAWELQLSYTYKLDKVARCGLEEFHFLPVRHQGICCLAGARRIHPSHALN